MHIKKMKSDYILTYTFVAVLVIIAAVCVIPFVLVLSSSLTDETTLLKYGYQLWPQKFSLEAYKVMFHTNKVFDAYAVTITETVVGTALSVICTSLMSYALSVKTLRYRNQIAFFVFFTMLFNGGLVPYYLLLSKYLHMNNSIWVLILPFMVNAWNMFLMRNFFSEIPDSFAEAAKIDGANDIYILFRIILPVSLPAIATIGLFYALDYWNQWFNALLFITNRRLYPLQYLMMDIMSSINQIAENAAHGISSGNYTPPAYSARMATAMMATGPILFVYPFVQKYFVKGLVVGGVKG